MDVKHLNQILAIAAHRNMTKAAESLFVSQSALSQYVARLEQELGTPLFLRSKGELTLTPAGKLYVDAAHKVVQIQQDLYKNIAALNNRGHIVVGVTSNWGLRMLSEIIPQFKMQYPEMSIELTETNVPALKRMLMDKTIDIGIAAAPDPSPFGELTQILRQEEVFLAVPHTHPYVQTHPQKDLTIETLIDNFRNDNFLLSKKGSSLRQLCEQLFHSYGFAPAAFCETNSITATRNMVAGGNGVAFIPESCSVDRERIHYYSLTPALYRLNLFIQRKDWVQNEPEKQFVEHILRYFPSQNQKPYLAI